MTVAASGGGDGPDDLGLDIWNTVTGDGSGRNAIVTNEQDVLHFLR